MPRNDPSTRMIPARPSAWAERVFDLYLTRLFKRHFSALHFLGEPPQVDPALPLLLLPNHSTWWDGFFIHLLNKKIFHRRPYLMMLEEQLRRYPFFSRVGVFSVAPNPAQHTRASLRYAAQLLQDARNLVCLFPQGELASWEKRPLQYKRGLELILKLHDAPVNLLPLAIRLEFLGEQLPAAFFLFGENKSATHETFAGMAQLERETETLLEELRAALARGERGQSLG